MAGVKRGVEAILPGQHVCAIYETAEERFRALVPFVIEGLARNRTCVCVAADGDDVALPDVLQGAGLDLDDLARTGRLTILAGGPDMHRTVDALDPLRAVDGIVKLTNEALARGAPALQLVGEMSWVLGRDPHAQCLSTFEAHVTRVSPELPAAMLCQYHRARFTPEVLREMIIVHPLLIVGDTLCRNPYHVPVELFLAPDWRERETTWLLDNLRRLQAAEDLLVESRDVAALGADVGMALTAGATVREILQGCCEAIVRQLGASFARIWTLNAATNVLELQASAGMYTQIDGPDARVPVGELKIGLIAEERRPHLSNDVENDPRIGDPEWARREGMRSFAGHPLLVGGELVGVMAMFSRTPLTGVALTALGTVADAIAVRIRGKLVEQANLALEAQLRQSQKMEAVGRLAGGIAHDFNNLLCVVLSYSELMMRDLKEGDPIRDDIVEVHRAGVRAADLTRQLLMFSRNQVIAPKVLDLNVVLADLDKMLRRVVGEDVEWTSTLGESIGLVRVDPGSIAQVIMNLVINARDAMPKGGKLTIETANVVLDDAYARSHLGTKPGAYVMLSVTDTGTGIDSATLSRVFEPFFTTKEKGKGTGLGLSTVFGIVQQSDGTVWVSSEPGIGTTFKVYLP
ncbi:MAG: domain S-box-containing protein, partial [Myxococcaceae bacterium]|nr:domain S-box-containing protein [Myxococcaceae bacterium]